MHGTGMAMGRGPTTEQVTLAYKTVCTPNPSSEGGPSEIPLHLDLYLPDSRSIGIPTSEDDGIEIPVVVYFHGGGLVVGDRKSWFPGWLQKRLSAHGVAFLSADHRLIPPSTGHDILEDIQDLFAYIRNDLNSALAEATGNPRLRIDVDAIAVAGTSAGGLCAYLCGIHLSPKPRALLSMYGKAGQCMSDHFLEPKTKPFLPDKPLVDPSDFAEFIFPQSAYLPITAESPLEYYPPTHPTPGLPAAKRMYLNRLYYQLGEWLDYYTGDHTLSARLRQLRPSLSGAAPPSALDLTRARELIREQDVGLFPQFGVGEHWPSTLLVHGSEDKQVPILESKHLVERLKAVGVESELIVVEGQEHTFDYASNAESEFGGLFDRAATFLVRNLRQ